jgi:hypothetical protein
MMLNRNLQDINMQNMDTELVAQMFKNSSTWKVSLATACLCSIMFTYASHERLEGSSIVRHRRSVGGTFGACKWC